MENHGSRFLYAWWLLVKKDEIHRVWNKDCNICTLIIKRKTLAKVKKNPCVCHLGVRKTLVTLAPFYYWLEKYMRKSQYSLSCSLYQQTKPSHQRFSTLTYLNSVNTLTSIKIYLLTLIMLILVLFTKNSTLLLQNLNILQPFHYQTFERYIIPIRPAAAIPSIDYKFFEFITGSINVG